MLPAAGPPPCRKTRGRRRERPVVREGESVYALDGLTGDIDGTFLAADGIARVTQALVAGELPPTTIDGERIGAPIARPAEGITTP